VTKDQARLTSKLLVPALDDLMGFLLAVRAETDAALAPRMPVYAGKPYPLGRCQEINADVLARLKVRLAAPADRGARALKGFIMNGGVVRPIWGALRGRYFQNALQVGGLYVDVSNDTVVPTKPKVEILPIAESGLEPVRDAAHFAEIAAAYWGVTVYANHAVPSLAPILPMLSWIPGTRPQLQAASDYMTELFRRDGFAAAEAWLTDGPAPPTEAVAAMRALCPPDLAADGDGRAAAIAACRDARAQGLHRDMAWRNARIADYLRIPGGDCKI